VILANISRDGSREVTAWPEKTIFPINPDEAAWFCIIKGKNDFIN